MTNETEKIVPLREYHSLLPVLMKAIAVILFLLWGLTHLIKPEWYLVTVMGIDQYIFNDTYDSWSANLIGVLNVAFAITIWRASYDPIRFKIVIDMILMVSVGTVIVMVYSLLVRDLSQLEWINVGLISGSILALLFLYPKKKP